MKRSLRAVWRGWFGDEDAAVCSSQTIACGAGKSPVRTVIVLACLPAGAAVYIVAVEVVMV